MNEAFAAYSTLKKAVAKWRMDWHSHEIPVMSSYRKDGINVLWTYIARPAGTHDTVLINQWHIHTAVHPWDDSWWNSKKKTKKKLHRGILFFMCCNILTDIHYSAIIKPYNWLKLLGRGAYCICWCGVLADSDVMRWSKRLLPFAKCLNQMRHFQWDGWCRAKLSVFSWQASQAAFQTPHCCWFLLASQTFHVSGCHWSCLQNGNANKDKRCFALQSWNETPNKEWCLLDSQMIQLGVKFRQ